MSSPSQNPLEDLIHEIHRRSLWQVLAIYLVGGWIAFEVVQTLTEGLGLPEWFPPLAVILLIIGLPIVLATAFVQEGGPGKDDEEPAVGENEASPSSRLFTWRNAILGGVSAFAFLGVLAAGWLLFGGGRLPAGLSSGPPASDSSGRARQSVAVLPFENMSADPDNEYFSDGITEEILNALTQVQGLRVPARTSSFAFKDQNVTIQQIADTLDVTHVVEGSVRRAGDRVRITAQLIDARHDEHLWSETYERSLEDVFAVQAEIARSITDALEVRLAGGDTASLAVEGTDSPEAHDAYLQGRYFWNQRTGESLQRAAERFRTAIELDSTYAEAWSGLADTYSVMPFYEYMGSMELSLPQLRERALEAARRAVDLAPDRGMTHTSLAYAHFFNGQWEQAEGEFRRALELNPGYATAHQWFGEFLASTGRAEKAIPHARRAVELDPVSKIASSDLGATLYHARRFEEAERALRDAAALDPTWPHAHLIRTIVFRFQERYEDALDAYLRWAQLADSDTAGIRNIYQCAIHYRETGEPGQCEPRPNMSVLRRIQMYFFTGQRESGLRELERLIERGTFDYRALAREHMTWRDFDLLRNDARYQKLMERVGITW